MNTEVQTSDAPNQEIEQNKPPLYGPEDLTYSAPMKFTFKQRTIKDADGNELGKAKKQPALTASIVLPTPKLVIELLQSQDPADARKQELLMDAINGIIKAQAKSQLDEVIDSFGLDEERKIAATDIDYDKLSLDYIASIEPKARGVAAIPEEDWNAFYQDYLVTMIKATGKAESKIKNHLEIFKKPTKIRQNLEAVNVMIDQLNIYVVSSSSIEDTGECASRLKTKFEGWAKAESKYDVNAL